MAIHSSQQPYNIVEPDRNREEQESNVDHPQEQPALLVPNPPVVVARVNANGRKRGRKETAIPAATVAAVAAAEAEQATFRATANNSTTTNSNSNSNFLFLQQALSHSYPPQMLTSPLQFQPKPASFVSDTDFQVLEEQQKQHLFFNQPNPVPPPSAQVFEAFAPVIKQYQAEVEGYLRAQNDQLRRTLSEKWQCHCRTLLCATEMMAVRRIREKKAEAEQAMRECAELQRQLARARVESTAWQVKTAVAQANAVAAQHDAAVLRTQLERAAAAAGGASPEGTGESGLADDAESLCHADPLPAAPGSCRLCGRGNAAVAVVPCGHLCLCADCGTAGPVLACPFCGRLSGGVIPVVFC